MLRRAWWLFIVVLGVACSGDGESKAPRHGAGADGAAAGAAGVAPTAGMAGASAHDTLEISEDCRGFSFDGLVYSPGGDALPNKCKPFNPTTNNPYAVRCMDVWSWYKTDFPGDEFCILPPPPDKGIQYGVHPQGKQWFEQVSKGDMSGYEDIADEWLLKDGDERQANYQTGAQNEDAAKYYRNYARMRPGSHHMIVSSQPSNNPPEETWGPANTAGLMSGIALPGAQRPDENAPKSLEKPDEDSGLFSTLPKQASVTFNMHHFNVFGRTILKEAWTNLWWESDARIQVQGILGLEFAQVGSLAVPPGETRDLHYSWNIKQPVRIVNAFGHRHAWTSNFSAWVEKPDGELDILYQSFRWLDEPTYRYDSMTQNPTPAPNDRSDGASSGLRTLMPGQKLHFNCHIEFTNERAASEKAPSPAQIGTLHFANEAFTAEMCILFGSTAAVRLPQPVSDNSELPDFATLD